MTISELGSIGELLGALGVILSLIFVGVQIKRNTETLRLSNRETSTSRTIEHARYFASDAVSEIYLKGLNDYNSLNALEQFRFGMALYSLCADWNDQYLKYRQRLIEEGMWEVNLQNLRQVLTTPGALLWLNQKRMAMAFPSEFDELLRREIPGYRA